MKRLALLLSLLLLCACEKRILVLTARVPDDGGAADGGTDAAPADSAAFNGGSAFEQTCMLADGVPYCWGENALGQASSNGAEFLERPTRVAEVERAAQVCAAEAHSCALEPEGSAVCWGDNAYGQLGANDFAAHRSPTPIADLRFRSIGCGGNTTCAVSAEGALYCWGKNDENQVQPFASSNEPQAVAAPTAAAPALSVEQVSVGQGHVCALSTDGALYCWGRNSNAQLAVLDRAIERLDAPHRVDASSAYTWVAAGLTHSCALRDAELWCWGANDFGQMGVPGTLRERLAPTRVPLPGAVQTAATSWFHTCAITTDGALYCWGRNDEGQTGAGSDEQTVLTPTQVGRALDWTHVITGRFHTCGLRGAGALYCWGKNDRGQLGFEASEHVSTPRLVSLP